jgi:hypothetical protein
MVPDGAKCCSDKSCFIAQGWSQVTQGISIPDGKGFKRTKSDSIIL